MQALRKSNDTISLKFDAISEIVHNINSILNKIFLKLKEKRSRQGQKVIDAIIKN